MADEKKVMDVASPGTAKPDTGSKPMVIGHKSIASDPSVTTEDKYSEEIETEKKITSVKKIRLKPLSDQEKENENEEESEPEKDDSEENASNLKTLEPESSDENKSEVVPESTSEPQAEKDTNEETAVKPDEEKNEEKEPTKEEKQESIDKEQIEREEKLQQLIKSKEYYVEIKKSNAFSFKTFFVTLIIVLVFGLLILLGLADAEIIDLGIDLPFDIL